MLLATEMTRLHSSGVKETMSPDEMSTNKRMRDEHAVLVDQVVDLKSQLEDLASMACDFNLTPRAEVGSL